MTDNAPSPYRPPLSNLTASPDTVSARVERQRAFLESLFRAVVVVSTVIYAVFWFAPWWSPTFYTDAELAIWSYAGYGARLHMPAVVSTTLFIAWLATSVGLWLFVPVARIAFACLYVAGFATGLMSGFVVQTPVQSALLTLVTLCDGCILTMAYLTPVAMRFQREGGAGAPGQRTVRDDHQDKGEGRRPGSS